VWQEETEALERQEPVIEDWGEEGSEKLTQGGKRKESTGGEEDRQRLGRKKTRKIGERVRPLCVKGSLGGLLGKKDRVVQLTETKKKGMRRIAERRLQFS